MSLLIPSWTSISSNICIADMLCLSKWKLIVRLYHMYKTGQVFKCLDVYFLLCHALITQALLLELSLLLISFSNSLGSGEWASSDLILLKQTAWRKRCSTMTRSNTNVPKGWKRVNILSGELEAEAEALAASEVGTFCPERANKTSGWGSEVGQYLCARNLQSDLFHFVLTFISS